MAILGCLCPAVLGHFSSFWGVPAWLIQGVSAHFGAFLQVLGCFSEDILGCLCPAIVGYLCLAIWDFSKHFGMFLSSCFEVSLLSHLEGIFLHFGVSVPGHLGAFLCILGPLCLADLGCLCPAILGYFCRFQDVSPWLFRGASVRPF